MAYFTGQPPKEKAIAYCHNPKHLGFLSLKLIKAHKCLDKHCKYLHPYEDKPYWIDRKRRRTDKKLREYIRKNNIEGIGEIIARLIYESSTQEMGDTDFWGENDDL